jgi:PPOX class probable F420-dependent enzyme
MAPTREQIDAFLNTPGLLGRLATVGPDGMPHVVPLWYLWQDGIIWIHSYRSTLKVGHLRKHPQCALVVDVENAREGITAVLVKGRAALITDPALVRPRAEAVYRRYLNEQELMAPDPQSWLDSPEGLIIQLVPDKVHAW